MRYPILIRIDDVCPTMDEEKFNRCIEFLAGYGYKPLLGIIPDCQDENLNYGCVEDFWQKIQSLHKEGYPIAMHGTHHVYTQRQMGLVCKRPKSEFAGLPFETQYELLCAGKRILRSHDLDTNIFFAPGHSYDKNTLKALYKAKFSINSDGKSFWPYEYEKVLHIPVNGPFRIHFGRGVLTIALHPSADPEKAYGQLESYLKENQSRMISWDEAIKIKNRPYFWCRLEERINMMMDSMIEKTADTLRRLKNKAFKRL